MHSYRLFKEPVKKHSPVSRPSAVKSEGKFVQVDLPMVRTERALVGAEQPPFTRDATRCTPGRIPCASIPGPLIDVLR
jgi:hypothetical protein